LYGMKQAGHVWNCTLHEKMVYWGFTLEPQFPTTHLKCEHCIYYCKDEYGTVVCAIHVDD
ncbi:hypothetical protein PAXRUDRAFT_91142, partial [Paxillus rubicundulus Ve08.2h10]